MAEKNKHIRKPLLLTATVLWVGYVFLVDGIGDGVVAIFLILLVLIAMNLEL